MLTDTIKPRELYGDSLLMRVMFNRLGAALTVPGACLLWAAVQAGVLVALCWAQGTLYPSGAAGELTLVEDSTALAYCLILPLIFLLLHYSVLFFVGHLNHLQQALDLSAPPNANATLIDVVRRLFQPARSRWIRLVFVLGGLGIFVFNAIANLFPEQLYQSPQKWDGIAYPLSYLVSRLLVLFVWGYAVPLWLSEVYLQFLAIYRIHATMAERGWIRVSPYALDRFGGLRNLSASASRPGYLLMAAGVFFLAPTIRSLVWGHSLHIGNYLGLGLYGLFAVGGMLLPLFLVHRVLARKQLEMLRFLSTAFDHLNARVMAVMKKGDLSELGDAELGRSVETVERLRRQWYDLPLWPLSVSMLVKLAVAAAPPAVLYLKDHMPAMGL